MQTFIALSDTYIKLNAQIHNHKSVADYVPVIIECLNHISSESIDKSFSDKASRIAIELKSFGSEITPNNVEEIWLNHDIEKFMKHGIMIFTPFVVVERIAKKGDHSMTQKDWNIVYKCIEYNTLMINKQRDNNKILEIDPRAEYLLRHSEEIIRHQRDIQTIMSYPIDYVAIKRMIPPSVKYTDPRSSDYSKLQLFNDLCELYAISMMAGHWLDQGNAKLNALKYYLTVTNVNTILPMRCRYINQKKKDVLHHLNNIYHYIQAFISDPHHHRSTLIAAEPELIALAYHAGIDWSDIRERYAQTNIDYNKARREQEEEEEEPAIDAGDIQLEDYDEAEEEEHRPSMIEATAGKHGKKKKKKSSKKKKNKQKVKFNDKHRS